MNRFVKLRERVIADRPNHVWRKLNVLKEEILPMPVIGTTDEFDLEHAKPAPSWLVSADPRFAIDQLRFGSLALQQHTE